MKKLLVFLLTGAVLTVAVAQTFAASPKDEIKEEDYQWWRKARFGIFIHWNTSSMLALGAGSWQRGGKNQTGHSSNETDDQPFVFSEEIRRKYWGTNQRVPRKIYDNMYKAFNPDQFNADEWARVFKEAGAGYIVFTSKHHDGFCMFDTKYTKYNIMNTPFKRDVAKELSDACAKQGLQVLWYYSVVDWYDPRFNVDNPKPYEDYLVHQVDELFGHYKNVRGVWWDGGGIKIDAQRVWRTIKKHCAHPIANGRGIRLPGVVFGTPEQRLGSINVNYPWESCVTMQGEGWFWNGGKNIKPLNSCLRLLVDAASGDGNLLLDFGPTDKGTIPEKVRTNYLGMGKWLKQYGDSIYGTRGGPYTPALWGGSTRKGHTVFLHITQVWPTGKLVLPPIPAKVVGFKLLTGGTAAVEQAEDGSLRIKIPPTYHRQPDTILALKLDRSVMDLPLIRCKVPRSLTRDAEVTASSELRPWSAGLAKGVVEYSCEYTPDGKRLLPRKKIPDSLKKKMPWLKVDRGHIWRYWMAKPDDPNPWLQVDLGSPKTFRRVWLFEKFNRITSYEIQVETPQGWKTIFKGEKMGTLSLELPQPVTAQRVRVVIHSYHSDSPDEGPGIRQFDLFEF